MAEIVRKIERLDESGSERKRKGSEGREREIERVRKYMVREGEGGRDNERDRKSLKVWLCRYGLSLYLCMKMRERKRIVCLSIIV